MQNGINHFLEERKCETKMFNIFFQILESM